MRRHRGEQRLQLSKKRQGQLVLGVTMTMACGATELQFLDHRSLSLGVAGDVVELKELVTAAVDTASVALGNNPTLTG